MLISLALPGGVVNTAIQAAADSFAVLDWPDWHESVRA